MRGSLSMTCPAITSRFTLVKVYLHKACRVQFGSRRVKMSDISEDDNEISFQVKFLGRVEVVRPDGLQILSEAAQSLKTPDKYSSEKAAKKSKVHLFLSLSGIDVLENKTKFLFRHEPLLSVPEQEVFSLAGLTYWGCLPSFKKEESIRGGRDLIVEALRHKNKVLQRENAELKRRLAGQTN
ncbi:hypothetical protein PFLUV_G00062490 [Perca fluviatilis]|uniref:PID domain-containing protein n=1 Tax=Perca fluviatilis TaxID=8168 RepID=A0A6A5FN08_PERFL|nr:hypothetical protein PFLUV_G00062490 [Perca fluviatilis]